MPFISTFIKFFFRFFELFLWLIYIFELIQGYFVFKKKEKCIFKFIFVLKLQKILVAAFLKIFTKTFNLFDSQYSNSL